MRKKENILQYLFVLILFFLTYLVLNMPERHCVPHGQQDMSMLFKQDIVDLRSCAAIIQGDMDGVDQDNFSRLLNSNKEKSALSENYYINATIDCQAFIAARGYLTVPLSNEEEEFPIAYSMVIHEKIEMFERLLRAVYTPQNVYCVHVDNKSSENFVKAVRAIISCFHNVFLSSKRESVVYASWSRVQADLNCMQDLIKHPVKWRYLLNTCGTDFPIKTNAEMVLSLKHLNGKNSMESETTNSYKKLRWEYHHNVSTNVIRTNTKKTQPPINTPMYSGNAYIVVSRKFVEHLFSSHVIQNFMEWEKDTYSPDEHMWATLQRMPTVPGSNPPNKKYDESDMLSIARLVKWSYLEGSLLKGAPYLPCTGKHRHAVCVYGAGDLNWILRQKHLFANKFDPQVDNVVIKCLEAFLRHKAINGQSFLTTNTMK